MITSDPILPEVKIIQSTEYNDDRGSFTEIFKASNFTRLGLPSVFVQENQVYSKKDVLRGLHYQLKFPQGKLVRCLSGNIMDVIVDIRTGSPTFSKHTSIEISEYNRLIVYIPEGYAHGYIVKSNNSLVVYNCTNEFDIKDEYGIVWNDSILNIDWGLEKPILSQKDSNLPCLKEQEFLPQF